MRSRDVAALAVVLGFSLSCSDAGVDRSPLLTGPATASVTAELNTVEGLIVALFPSGLENAALQRWATVERAVERGDARAARQHMTQLADFVLKMQAQGRLEDPDSDGPMTVNDGVLKLIALMFGEVFPGEPAPPTTLTGDFVIAVVDGSRQTVVTPAEFAGVHFPAGAAAEPFVLVIMQYEFVQDGRCDGPLDTRLCQYPRFYEFHPFPYTVLTRPANFGVCHEVHGDNAPSKEVDARLRLAHDAPTEGPRPGYQRVDGAEILPYATVDFLECHPHTDVIDKIAELAGKLFLPKKAYAIDIGGGGSSDMFSNFNVVDPGPPPSPDGIVIGVDPRPPKIHPNPRDR
jgi:hypothetical protein